MRYRCPRCERKAVDERSANTLSNVRRRTIHDIQDRLVCRECDWTGGYYDIDTDKEEIEHREQNNVTEW